MLGCGFQSVSGSSLNIQEFATGMATGWDNDECSVIQVWNGTSLDSYYYQGYDEDAQGNMLSAWLDNMADTTDLVIPAQTGFWIKNRAAGTLVWSL